MKPGAHEAIAAAARVYGPLIGLFAFGLLALREPGAGVGLVAGLAFALMVALHALVFGADAARAAAPPWIVRILLALGVCAAMAAAAVPSWRFASELGEAGLFLVTGAGASLSLTLLSGRAPTLRDEEW